MRLIELTAYHVRIPLKSKIKHASHAREATDSLLVRCKLDDGSVGWGEGLPRSYVTGETIDDAFKLLASSPLAEQLGRSCGGLHQAIEMAESLKLTRSNHDPRNCFGNSIRCAIEVSFLDAVCRSLNVPLSEVTRQYGPAAGVRQDQAQVRYSVVITSMSPLKQRLKSWLAMLYGFQQLKLKVGVEGVDDIESVRRVRKAVGRSMDLRLDANEAWHCENLERVITPLLEFGITAIEQPVPHEEVSGLAAIRSRVPVPIVLDESLCSLEDAHAAIESNTCDLFNIRLSKCGGFLNSLKLAATAHRAALGYQLGCQVGETGILSAAGRHFATSVSNIRYLEGSYDRFLVRERLTHEDLTWGRGGQAPALPGPGLGITVDEAAVKRVTISERTFVER